MLLFPPMSISTSAASFWKIQRLRRDDLLFFFALIHFFFLGVSVTLPRRAFAAEKIQVLSVFSDTISPARLKLLEATLLREVSRYTSLMVIPPSRGNKVLEDNTRLAEHRKSAVDFLTEASALVITMKYDKALPLLDQAESHALAGLARLTECKLLSHIYLQRAIALLPLDETKAHQAFVQSFFYWPGQELDRNEYPPRILQHAKDAIQQAEQLNSLPRFEPLELENLAQNLQVQQLLIYSVRQTDGMEEMSVSLFDLDKKKDARARTRWTVNSAPEQVSGLINSELLGSLPFPSPLPEKPSRSRNWIAWTVSSLSGAALLGGSIFSVLAYKKSRDAEALADRKPLLDYDPEASSLVQAASQYKTAAIVSFAMAAAAAATATTLWLWPKQTAEEERVNVAIGVGGFQVTLDFP
jgi:hypothetical protein